MSFTTKYGNYFSKEEFVKNKNMNMNINKKNHWNKKNRIIINFSKMDKKKCFITINHLTNFEIIIN